MTAKTLLLTFLCLFLLSASAYSQVDTRLYSEAKAAEAEGKTDMAFLLYRQIVTRYPDSKYVEEAQFLIGKYYYGSRNYVAADKTFRDHLRKFPHSRFSKEINDYLARMQRRSLKDRADTLFEEGKLDAASVLYHQYLEIDPDNAEVKARIEQIKEVQKAAHFGFEQINRERKKLEQEKADLNRQIQSLEEQRKKIQAMRQEAEELNKTTVARYEKQLASVHSQVESLKNEMSQQQRELDGWRQRAVLAEAMKLSQPLPKRFKPVPGETPLPRIIFEGEKKDPSPEEGETQVTDIFREGFPVVVLTQAKLDAQQNLRHIEAIVSADLISSWPSGARIKFRVNFIGKEGQPAPDPAFIVRYYGAPDMEEIDETTRSYRKRVLFTAEEDKVERYEVSAFLVRSQ